MASAVQALTHYQTYPERHPGADLPPKKSKQFGPDGAPFPSKRQLPEGPQNRRSGLVGPHTTPPIVNYKYMTSTL